MFRLIARFRDVVDQKSTARFQDDKGIAMVFVALLLVMLFGMVAFAVDTGALYQERRELQNGADAAVLAIAEDCGRGTVSCDTSTATDTAEAYADDNAGDDRARIFELILDTSAQTIEVATETETTDGGTIFRPFFAQVIGFTGTTVGARAKAAWGSAAGGELPITVSECEWQRSAGRMEALGFPANEPWYPHLGSDYQVWEDTYGPVTSPDPEWTAWDPTAIPAIAPPDPFLYDPGVGVEFIFHTSTPEITECSAVAGQDADGDNRLPGSFGWLEDAGGCYAEAFNGEWYEGEPGNGVPCTRSEIDALLGTTVLIPVFVDFKPPGPDDIRSYQMIAPMALYVTGYRFPGNSGNLGSGQACKGATSCLVGYPTVWAGTTGEIDPDAEYRGALIVKLTG
ncbi:MAG: Tad domain-containing protein [Acidimicrobiia bacterium]|nr:Tad domain-containing protein [Acidimicrobiia bacterium]